jgi:hypothetical protein
MLIDTHCHLDFPEFVGDLPGVRARAAEAGVSRMITISTRVKKYDVYRGIAESTLIRRMRSRTSQPLTLLRWRVIRVASPSAKLASTTTMTRARATLRPRFSARISRLRAAPDCRW